MTHPICFVSGIDTDAGKTVVTGLLARYLLKQGVDVITVKLIQTGNPPGFSEDRAKHREMMGGAVFPEDAANLTAPQIFRFPSSPHLAAALEHREVDLSAMRRAVREVAAAHAVTLVEGAGGLAVPLTEDCLTIDFVREEGWPTILVTNGRLGSLNHTLLSIEALTTRNMRLEGVVYNAGIPADPTIEQDTCRMIRKYLKKYGQSEAFVAIPRVDFANLPDPDFRPIFGV